MQRDVYKAIADPIRREILNLVAHQILNVNAVSENFDVSRAAIYKHLKLLEECGMVRIKQQGRERICEARLEKLGEVSEWVEQYREMWTAEGDSVGNHQDEAQPKKKKKKKHGKKKKDI